MICAPPRKLYFGAVARRIEIELTSARPDGTWAWRAAGALNPRGALDATLLYSGAKAGDVVRAEAEFGIDGITVVSVEAPRSCPEADPNRIQLIEPPAVPGVTTQLTGNKGRSSFDRPERSERRRPSGPPGSQTGRPPDRGARGPLRGADASRANGNGRGPRPPAPDGAVDGSAHEVRADRGERRDRPDRPDRPERPDRGAQPDRPERADRPDRAGGPVRPSRPATGPGRSGPGRPGARQPSTETGRHFDTDAEGRADGATSATPEPRQHAPQCHVGRAARRAEAHRPAAPARRDTRRAHRAPFRAGKGQGRRET